MALMRQSFDIWAGQERGKLLCRVIEKRRLRSAFSSWKREAERVATLDQARPPFVASSNLKVLHKSLSRWRDVLGRRRNMALKADLIFEIRSKSALFKKWRAASNKEIENVAIAQKAYTFFTLRKMFKSWKVAMSHHRMFDFIDVHEKQQMRRVLGVMRARVAQTQLDDQAIAIFQASQDKVSWPNRKLESAADASSGSWPAFSRSGLSA